MTHRPRWSTTVFALCLTAAAVLFAALAPLEARAQGASGQYDAKLYQAMKWRGIGPARGGRVTAVTGVIGQPYTYYFGATGGGVWKTTSGGQKWSNVSDGFFNTGTIGAIAVAASDPNVVYAGTGESPVRGVSTSSGDGVYKSTDAGKTWSHVGLRESRHISQIRIHPDNPDLVYVAAQGPLWAAGETRGIYRSRDGGATWSRVLYVDGDTGAHDLAMDVTNPRILYAAMWDHRRTPWNVRSGGPGSGLWKTVDGGDNWSQINDGLPKLMGNTGVAVSPANPNRVWAMIEATEGGVFRSDNAGKTWKRVNSDNGIRDRGWYYTHVFADPVDADTMYVLSAAMVKSTDGGVTMTEVKTPHGDNHDLWINPADNRIMVQGNDGGTNVSFDGGKTWSDQHTQSTAQFYRVITDNQFPYRLYAGQQDNTAISIASRTFNSGIGKADYHRISGGESAHVAFDPDNPRLVYGTSLLGTISEYDARHRTWRNIVGYPYFPGFRPGSELKQRFNWNAPVVVSVHDPKVIYHGANMVLKSEDRGNSWTEISPDLTANDKTRQGTIGGPLSIEGAGGEHYGTLMYIAESPHDAGTIWTGSDDGRVFLTRNGGRDWRNVTPRRMGETMVNMVEVSPHDPATAYIAVTRYKFNDFSPHIYKTSNYGRSWQHIANGIGAEHFVRVVREDPARRGLLYAGTEGGAYVSFNDGRQWQSLQLNLPMVPVNDLRVHDNDLVAATQGRAFWILDDLTPLQQITDQVAAASMHLFAPRDTYRVWARGWQPKPGKNPPNGVVIQYAFSEVPDTSENPVTLEILDSDGNVIRAFSSAPPKQEKKAAIKGVQGEPPAKALPIKAGMNRYVWNMRAKRLTSTADVIRYVSTRPYKVAPGAYTARLGHGGNTRTQGFNIVPDPRLPESSAEAWADQQAQVSQAFALADTVHVAVNRSRSVIAQVRAMIGLTGERDGAAAIAEAGGAIIDKLVAWEIHVPQPDLPNGVQDTVSFPSRLLSTQVLYVVMALDQEPPVTAGARARLAEVSEQWAGLKADLDAILETDLAAFNALLGAGQVPHIVTP